MISLEWKDWGEGILIVSFYIISFSDKFHMNTSFFLHIDTFLLWFYIRYNISGNPRDSAHSITVALRDLYRIMDKTPDSMPPIIFLQVGLTCLDYELENRLNYFVLCFILPWKALTLYTQTSVQYLYSLYSSPYIFFNTDKENLFYNQNFLGWWSLPSFSWF